MELNPAVAVEVVNPVTGAKGTGPSALSSVIVPSRCTPSMTVYSLAPIAYAFTLYKVQPISGGTSWSIPGFSIITCTTLASSGIAPQSCSAGPNATALAGDIITLVAATTGTMTAPAGAFLAFSCF